MRWFVSAIVVLALVAGLWWLEHRQQAELAPEPDVDIPTEPEEAVPRYPLPQSEPRQAPATAEPKADESRTEPEARPEPPPSLPGLNESDAAARRTLSNLLGNDFVEQWVKPEFVISRMVAIVNSLDGAAPALKAWPLNPLDSEPATEEQPEGEALLWTKANAERYAALVDAIASLPPEQAAAMYRRYYPLFQQAWDELGESEPYFNDRLIDIIDHLLASPEVELPFEVVPYEGRLRFGDTSLQEASWGRKLLMRMGKENAGKTKEWLRHFRNALVEQNRVSASTARSRAGA